MLICRQYPICVPICRSRRCSGVRAVLEWEHWEGAANPTLPGCWKEARFGTSSLVRVELIGRFARLPRVQPTSSFHHAGNLEIVAATIQEVSDVHSKSETLLSFSHDLLFPVVAVPDKRPTGNSGLNQASFARPSSVGTNCPVGEEVLALVNVDHPTLVFKTQKLAALEISRVTHLPVTLRIDGNFRQESYPHDAVVCREKRGR